MFRTAVRFMPLQWLSACHLPRDDEKFHRLALNQGVFLYKQLLERH